MKEKFQNRCGQGTVEVAFVLPVLMILILLLLEPGIYLYDLIVMKSAASEACRLVANDSCSDENFDDYIRRRLSAIPQTDIFHIHNSSCSYSIEKSRNEDGTVSVYIKNELKPLPLIDVFCKPFGVLNSSGNLEINTKSEMHVFASWELS